MLGAIRATDEEVAMIKAQLTDVQVETRAATDFYKGKLEGKEVMVVRLGIDKVSAVMCTQILADICSVMGMVSTGTADSLKTEIGIGDTVPSSDAVQHDMGATEFGYEPRQMPKMEILASKADEGLVCFAEGCCSKVSPDIHIFVGRVATESRFISDKDKERRLTDTLGGYCTEMERAAIAQVCYLNSIPSPIVRTISDKADDSATVGYPVFEVKAIIHSVGLLIEIVRSIRFR